MCREYTQRVQKMSRKLGVIGGTGLSVFEGLTIVKREIAQTPHGEPSAPLIYGEIDDKELVFLPRHGYGHTIPPHKVNYLANIYALKDAGVTHILAVAAVGGIRADMGPKSLVVPNQIIDYTYGRKCTFFEESLSQVTHVDFTEPYCESMRQSILEVCKGQNISVFDGGIYAATQGPRLETAAEINRLEKDGCDIVGMTGMPEAALARELELNYACLAVVANFAAGRDGSENITMEAIEANLAIAMNDAKAVIAQLAKII